MSQLNLFNDENKQNVYEVNLEPDIDKEYILSRITQEDIFEKYFGIEVQTKRHFRSPLRKDMHPTCSFSYYNGTLYFRDWSEPQPIDCWNLVMRIYSLDFYGALDKIAADFDLIDKDVDKDLQYKYKKRKNQKKSKSKKTKIQVASQSFTDIDKKYLKQYNINGKICNRYGCYSISKVWLNNKSIYNYRASDPAIGYYFGSTDETQLWKIYFYTRDTYRFVCNTNRLNGYQQIPPVGDILIITKSMKDVMSLASFDINAIAPQNETQLIDEQKMKRLKQRFNSIYSLYDFDYTGITMAHRFRSVYGVPPLFFTNGRFGTKDYGVKDFSDYVAKYGVEQTKNLINKVKNSYE